MEWLSDININHLADISLISANYPWSVGDDERRRDDSRLLQLTSGWMIDLVTSRK